MSSHRTAIVVLVVLVVIALVLISSNYGRRLAKGPPDADPLRTAFGVEETFQWRHSFQAGDVVGVPMKNGEQAHLVVLQVDDMGGEVVLLKTTGPPGGDFDAGAIDPEDVIAASCVALGSFGAHGWEVLARRAAVRDLIVEHERIAEGRWTLEDGTYTGPAVIVFAVHALHGLAACNFYPGGPEGMTLGLALDDDSEIAPRLWMKEGDPVVPFGLGPGTGGMAFPGAEER